MKIVRMILILICWCPLHVLQLSADDKFNSYMELTLQLASTQGLIPAVRSSSTKSALANAKAQLLLSLLDEDVGAVLGKKGQTLTQIQQVGGGGRQAGGWCLELGSGVSGGGGDVQAATMHLVALLERMGKLAWERRGRC